MNFIHIADVHLGIVPEVNKSWGINREKEIAESFLRVVLECEKNKIDLLLIAGDLFHKQPLLRELKEVNYMLSKLTSTKVVIIAGNHDYIGSRSNYLEFQWNKNVTMLRNSEMDSVYFEEINTEVYGFSFCTRDIYEAKYDKAYPGVEERINILLAHGGDERDIPINYKKLSEAGFDYVALGHIHKAEKLSERMAYAGSLEPLNKNELYSHGYYYGEIERVMEGEQDKGSRISLEFVPISLREYKRVEIKIEPDMANLKVRELVCSSIEELGEQHFYQFILEGKTDPEILVTMEDLYTLGFVVDVVNHTLPDYDFSVLYRENENNLIGSYILKIQESATEDSLRKRALYYGIEALLSTRER